MRLLISDNNSGVHPKILDAIYKCNIDHEISYGEDKYTEKAIELLKESFGEDIDVYFVLTGTAANVIGLSGVLRPFEGVVAPDTSHINTDECGSLERFGGIKILPVPNRNGKLHIDQIKKYLYSIGDEHQTQPRAISISQITELGTIYTIDEIREIADFAHENNMFLHVDGARIANAVVALNSSFKEMITDTKVDLLSFGGTKNGMMMGEAIISFNKEISKYLKYIRKQGMQLPSKMRFVSSQFIAYLEEEIWKENAINSNNMANYLRDLLRDIPNVEIVYESSANITFVKIPKSWNEEIIKEFPIYIPDEENNIIRLVTSYDTTKEDIDDFIKCIRKIAK